MKNIRIDGIPANADIRCINGVLSNPDIRYKLISIVVELIEKFGLSQVEMAKILNIDQPKISQLKSFKVSGFSMERLLLFLERMGCEVDIMIKIPAKVGLKREQDADMD